MPAPIRQRAKRNRLLKRFGKSLQAGRVHREGKLAVADRQGIVRIEICQDDIVPRDQCVPVNRAA